MFDWRRREGAEDLVSLTGASLISAAGSLVQHLAPFLAVAMIAGGWTSVAGAGWVRSVAQIGELAIALALPLIGIAQFGRKAVLVIALVFVLAIAMAGISHQPVFMLGWLAIGACCGALKYLGVMAAAKASRPTFAFSLRLAMVLMLAGVVAAALASGAGTMTYESMLLLLAVTLLGVLLAGMAMLRPGEAERVAGESATSAPQAQSRIAGLCGLATIYLFFAGVSGVMLFVLHQAAEHAMTISAAAWAIAATKLSVGIWLVASACYATLKGKSDRFFLQGVILVAATVGISLSRNGVELLCALFFFEVSVNSLSARIQGAVVRDAPAFVSRSLNVAILLGVATGPAINGFAVSIGQSYIYLLLGAFTAFAPALWYWRFGEGARSETRPILVLKSA